VDTSGLSDLNLHIMEKLGVYALDRDKLLAELDKLENEEHDRKYWHIMEWLASYKQADDMSKRDQVADHESFCEVRRQNQGSGDWIMQNETTTSWMEDDAPRHSVLWLNGIPGAGKCPVAAKNE
jgi:hypothetical protein